RAFLGNRGPDLRANAAGRGIGLVTASPLHWSSPGSASLRSATPLPLLISIGMELPMHQQLGLTDDELAAVEDELGRSPTDLELAMYAVMWSEHCSYKSSRTHLRRFPTEAPWVLVGPGEGAGVVDIGDGLAVAVRIESHNHPSAVEPYEGAA